MDYLLWFREKREGQEQRALKNLSESLTTLAKLPSVSAHNWETLCSKLSDLLSFTGMP